MILLHRKSALAALGKAIEALLATQTVEAKKLQPGAKVITSRWDKFRANKRARGAWPVVWTQLLALSHSKCALCERVGPDTVEHIETKTSTPARMFDWENLLAACSTCNRTRENVGNPQPFFVPVGLDPLDYFGWNSLGAFICGAAHQLLVNNTVRAYALDKYNRPRATKVTTVRALLLEVALAAAPLPQTLAALKDQLDSQSEHLGPVREYLVRPPAPDAAILSVVLAKLPALRGWVRPWLNPPSNCPISW